MSFDWICFLSITFQLNSAHFATGNIYVMSTLPELPLLPHPPPLCHPLLSLLSYHHTSSSRPAPEFFCNTLSTEGFSFFKIFYLFLGCVGSLLLHVQQQISLVAASWGLLSSCGVRASHCGVLFQTWALEHRLSSCVHRLSCSAAYGIFLDSGWNPCLLNGRWILYH